ncbi:MAG: hypothetical protein JWM91_723 [Rhodospirillales bacterium]|nr:hypothetical protein [Rhodospirillales bacterium]
MALAISDGCPEAARWDLAQYPGGNGVAIGLGQAQLAVKRGRNRPGS